MYFLILFAAAFGHLFMWLLVAFRNPFLISVAAFEIPEVGDSAFFALSRSRPRSKKECESGKKKEREKSERAERKRN